MRNMWDKIKIGLAAVGMFFVGWMSQFYEYGNPQEMLVREPVEVICFVGDTGTGNEDQKAVAELMDKNKCEAIFFLGDLIYPIGLKDVNDPQFFEKFYNIYNRSVMKYVVPGNHDAYNGNLGAWLKLAEKYADIEAPYYYYSVKMGDRCILAFDSFVYTTIKKGKFEKKQNKYIDEFVKREDCKYKVAIAHHSYRASDDSHGDAGKEMGTKRLKKFYEEHLIGKVNQIITGHSHILSDEGELQGTHFYVSGAGGKINECVQKRVWCEAKLGYLELKRDEFTFRMVK